MFALITWCDVLMCVCVCVGGRFPPGHGDVYRSLAQSGLLDQLQAEGIEYIFISNVDNLGATVDTAILQHFASHGVEFLMEVRARVSDCVFDCLCFSVWTPS